MTDALQGAQSLAATKGLLQGVKPFQALEAVRHLAVMGGLWALQHKYCRQKKEEAQNREYRLLWG